MRKKDVFYIAYCNQGNWANKLIYYSVNSLYVPSESCVILYARGVQKDNTLSVLAVLWIIKVKLLKEVFVVINLRAIVNGVTCVVGWCPRVLRCGSTAISLLGLGVRIPQGSCECYRLSCRGHCGGPITRPQTSYRLWCVGAWSSNLIEEA